MWQHKQSDLDQRGDQSIYDELDTKRYPLVMVPKDNDFDP